MNDLLLLFLSLSLSGSLLALLLFALRPLTRKRLSQSWQYYIWLIVLLRFLLPISPQFSATGELSRTIHNAITTQSAANLPSLDPQAGNGRATGNDLPASDLAMQGGPATAADDLPQAESVAAGGTRPHLLAYAGGAWLGVALVLIAYKAATYHSFSRFAKAGAVECSGGRLHDLYLDELAIKNIRRPLPLYVNDLISSPMLVGLWRPVIILPPLDAGDEELRHILRHELTHHKRRDGLYKWLAQLVLCLHWFNPLAYLVVRQLSKACELACDEAVVKQLGTEGRMGYGDALMASLKAQGRYSSTVISLTMSEDAGAIKERLDAIAGYRGRTMWTRASGAALTILLLCGFAFTGAYRPNDQPGLSPDSLVNAGNVQENSSGNNNRMPRGTSRTPEDVSTVTARAGGALTPNASMEIVIVDDAAVNLTPTSSQEISVDYGDSLYDVSIEQKNGDWRIRIAYTGSYSVYPAATLYLPDIVYGNVDLYADQATVYFDGVFRRGGTVNAHLESCSVFCTIPAGFAGTLNAIAPSSYFQLQSEDDYHNCDVAIANCDTFGNIADGFSKQGPYLVYSHGTGAGIVRVDMGGDGYFTTEPNPYDLLPGTINTVETDIYDLVLVEHEYTIAQLREQNIWGVKIDAASENVSISTGGQTLKLQYFQQCGEDYTLETVSDRGGTIRELYLLRNAATLDDTPRTIHITIPDGFDCDVLHLTTSSGGITLNGCRAYTVMLQTQSGGIWLDGGAVEDYFSATSADGGIDIIGALLPAGEFSNNLQTGSGTVRLQLPRPSGEYAFKIDAGSEARIQIGGESYSGGSAYTVNSGAVAGTIKFTSERGALIVEDS